MMSCFRHAAHSLTRVAILFCICLIPGHTTISLDRQSARNHDGRHVQIVTGASGDESRPRFFLRILAERILCREPLLLERGALILPPVQTDACTRLAVSSVDFPMRACILTQVNANRQICADRIAISMNSEVTAKRARRSLVSRAAMIYFVYVQPDLATYEINIPAPVLQQIRTTLRYALHDSRVAVSLSLYIC